MKTMTPNVRIPRLEKGKAEVGGPGYAFSPAWWWSEQRHVVVRCMCGHLFTLPTLQIDVRGQVWDTVECPTSSCSWRVAAVLEGWSE